MECFEWRHVVHHFVILFGVDFDVFVLFDQRQRLCLLLILNRNGVSADFADGVTVDLVIEFVPASIDHG